MTELIKGILGGLVGGFVMLFLLRISGRLK